MKITISIQHKKGPELITHLERLFELLFKSLGFELQFSPSWAKSEEWETLIYEGVAPEEKVVDSVITKLRK